MSKAVFITFEGLDCSGKSTIVKKLNDYFEDKKISFLNTREPGGYNNIFAEKIRDILLDNNIELDNKTEALLFATIRSHHVSNVIIPNLKKGKIIICDRYIDSSLVYQGIAKDVGFKEVLKLNEYAIDNCWPDLTIYLRIDIDTYNQRILQRQHLDRLDNHSIQLKSKIIDGYDFLAKKYKKRFEVIDATLSIDMVFNNVLNVLKERGIV